MRAAFHCGANARGRLLEAIGHAIGRDLDAVAAGQHVFQAPGSHQFAAIDNHHAVANLFHFRKDVRAQEDGLAFGLQARQDLQHLAAAGRIEAAGGLVEDHELRVAQQRLRDADALHHAARVLADPQVLVARQLDLLEHVRDERFGARRVPPGQGQVQPQEFGRRQVFIEREIFRQEADLGFGADVAGRMAQHADLAGIGEEKTHQNADAGGFAGAVGAQKSADFPRRRLERDIREGRDLFVAEQALVDLGHALEFNCGGRHLALQTPCPGSS